MKIFCSKCGVPKELEDTAASAIVTCVGCGNRFSAGPAPRQDSGTARTVIIVLCALIAVPVGVAIIGIVAAIAIPNYIKFQSRAKQGECRANLTAFATASRAHFAQHRSHTSLLAELGFSPERGNRYAYFAGPGTLEDRSLATVTPAATDTQVGVDLFKWPEHRAIHEGDIPDGLAVGPAGTCPDCSFTAVCLGNIDGDAPLDVWSVSTVERRTATGEVIPAGTPFNDINDLTTYD